MYYPKTQKSNLNKIAKYILTLILTLIIVYFDNSTTKSNNQCSTFRINTNSFNVERHGDHIKTYIHVDIT